MKISRNRFHNRPRRGVLLLVVLSLLVLFVLSGLTFVVVTRQYRRTARQVSVQERMGDPPPNLVDEVFYQVLRDTRISSPTSAISGQALLRDYYGDDFFKGFSTPNPTVLKQHNIDNSVWQRSGGQFIDLVLDANTAIILAPYSDYDDYFSGRVLTFLSGDLSGTSVRIVGSGQVHSTDPNRYLRLLVSQDGHRSAITPEVLSGVEFIVNGRIFNGTGSGLPTAPGATTLTQTDSSLSLPIALLPNNAHRRHSDFLSYIFGGCDEGYDAADFQNMALAWLPPGQAVEDRDTLPSFHRPALINYWFYQLINGGIAANITDLALQTKYMALENELNNVMTEQSHKIAVFEDPELRQLAAGLDGVQGNIDDPPAKLSLAARQALAHFKRQFILRPLRDDHPNFSGSNENFRTLVNNAEVKSLVPSAMWPMWQPSWDVDNDGDGRPDSIWIDAGLPIQSTGSGVNYKPMVSVLCVDLDNRLNVNAHGTMARLDAQQRVHTAKVATGTTSRTPAGLGYGPPEIRLDTLVQNNVQQLTNLFLARHGDDGVPGSVNHDSLARVKMIDEPKQYWQAGLLTSYSTPTDLHGELEHGMDVFGQINFESLDIIKTANSRADSPYEVNLVNPQGSDLLFTVFELEGVLRHYDFDSARMPTRISAFTNVQNNHRLVTTASFDPPVPGVPRGFILDRLRQRILENNNSLTDSEVNTLIFNAPPGKQLIWPGLMMNLPLDINRSIGNGRDDAFDTNLIVDDPIESQIVRKSVADDYVFPEQSWDRSADSNPLQPFDSALPGTFNGKAFHHTNGLGYEQDATLARHLLARHLYVLMMTLIDQPFDALAKSQVARETAQWAINVVDFRDADSIMTPFEYDENPFDGWDFDGRIDGYLDPNGEFQSPDDANTNNQRGVVWGCERPELIITETLAFHDRRTEDRDDDDGSSTTTTDAGNPDGDFDQRLVPRGSFFVELFNPWTSTTSNLPSELYSHDETTNDELGVDLQRLAQQNGATSPVWRLAVTASPGPGDYDSPSELLDPDYEQPEHNPGLLERRIYFINPALSTGLQPPVGTSSRDYAVSPQVSAFGALPKIQQGRYAVIGSPGVRHQHGLETRYESPVGRVTSASEGDATTLQLDSTRRITLTPNNTSSGTSTMVTVNNNFPSGVVPPGMTPVANSTQLNDYRSRRWNNPIPPVAVVIDEPRLSISEPVGGYPQASGQPNAPSDTDVGVADALVTVRDTPLDQDHDVRLLKDRTYHNFKTVHLQRLANPVLPWNTTTNPYITIDSMRCDLTCFNGVTKDPDSNADPATWLTRFRSVQRGDEGRLSNQKREFWSQEPNPTAVSDDVHGNATASTFLSVNAVMDEEDEVANPVVGHNFKYILKHSLGYVNDEYWGTANTPNPSPPTSRAIALEPTVKGDSTFGCLAWNDRPYVSHYELLNVPRTRQSQLLNEFTLIDTTQSPYIGPAARQFGHLWNFFAHDDNDSQTSDHSHRLFDYVRVPSRFVGTEKILNPSAFSQLNNITIGRLSPFNSVSNFREPGRVNVNTIFHPTVWSALTEDNSVPGPDFKQIVRSRRGFGADNAYLPDLDGNSPPTYFANPFRPSGSNNLVPIAALALQDDIDVTMLRPKGSLAEFQNGTANEPLFESKFVITDPGDEVMGIPRDTRNSCFRYEALRRFGNLLTTRSNVYAIWITVGFFEVERVAQDPAHPDGFTLGHELGSDTGDISRHRGFYVVDRTIPVAFEPGKNHNVDDCVLLRRYIE